MVIFAGTSISAGIFLCLIGLDCKKNLYHIHSGQNTSLPKAATDFFKKVGHFVCQKTHCKP